MPATKIRTALRTTGLTWDETFKAATDMSAACAIYKWVQPGSISGEVSFASVTPCATPWGILQNTPPAGCAARVRLMGKSIMAACFNACNLTNGVWVTVASGGVGNPSTCTIGLARWTGSAALSTSTAAWGGYGEVFLLGPGFATCINSSC